MDGRIQSNEDRRNGSLSESDGREYIDASEDKGWKNVGTLEKDGRKASVSCDRKSNDEWRFPSVNFAYYHSRLRVLNADNTKDGSDNSKYRNDNPKYRNDNPKYRNDNPKYCNDNPKYRNDNPKYGIDNPKYKTRRNSYDLIKDKCLAILNGKKRVRSVDDEAYQVSKVITIFDNVGQRHLDRKNSEDRKDSEDKNAKDRSDRSRERTAKQRQENSETKDDAERCGRIGSPRGSRRIRSYNDGSHTVVKQNTTEDDDNLYDNGSTKVGEEKNGSDTSIRLDSEKESWNEYFGCSFKEKLRRRSSDYDNISKATRTRDSGIQTKESNPKKCQERIQISTVQNSQHTQLLEEMERKLADRKGQKHARIEQASKTVLKKIHTLKTQATIEHRSSNQSLNKIRGTLPAKIEQKRTLQTHQRQSSVAQTFSQSAVATSPLEGKERIIKLLDSSHFVITKETDEPHEGSKVLSNVKTGELFADHTDRGVETLNEKAEFRNLEDRVPYKTDTPKDLKEYVESRDYMERQSQQSNTRCVGFENEHYRKSTDDIRADIRDRRGSVSEKIDEEFDAIKEVIQTNARDSGIQLEDFKDDPENYAALANQYRAQVNDETAIVIKQKDIDIHSKTLEEFNRNGSGVQELLASQLMKTDEDQYWQHDQLQYQQQEGYRLHQQTHGHRQQYDQLDKSQYTMSIRPSSVSTITASKRSKSSIQEDMLDIWLDHQKFLQRYPEDDSFYSFLFVFFAVFASFVLVLIVYFVMFVV